MMGFNEFKRNILDFLKILRANFLYKISSKQVAVALSVTALFVSFAAWKECLFMFCKMVSFPKWIGALYFLCPIPYGCSIVLGAIFLSPFLFFRCSWALILMTVIVTPLLITLTALGSGTDLEKAYSLITYNYPVPFIVIILALAYLILVRFMCLRLLRLYKKIAGKP